MIKVGKTYIGGWDYRIRGKDRKSRWIKRQRREQVVMILRRYRRNDFRPYWIIKSRCIETGEIKEYQYDDFKQWVRGVVK